MQLSCAILLLSDALLGFFHGYVCLTLFEEPKKTKTKKTDLQIKMVVGIVFAGMLLVILSQFTGLYYSFDSHNFYHRNTWYIVSLILPMAGMILDFGLIIQYRENITRRVMIPLLSYIVLPFVAAIVLAFYYGISWINIAISISMILMFVEAMIEQGQKVAQQERILARQERKIAEQNRELTESRIKTMMSQIRPHFIYNTLGSIEQLCELDPKMAAEMVHDFSRYLRGNFGELDNPMPIRMSQELEHIQSYIRIEQVRFPDIEITFDMKAGDFQIPALSVQPLIENAIKHGLMKLPREGTVQVSSYETETHYCVDVEDDGVGFDTAILSSDEKHVGLRNIRGRLEAMCDGVLVIESMPGVGTKVSIRIPKR